MLFAPLSILALSAALSAAPADGAGPAQVEEGVDPAERAAEALTRPRDTERERSLLESAAAGLQAISNLEAEFTQIAPSGRISTGRLFLSRPGKLRFEYDEPNPMLIVATGGLVYVHDNELNTTDSYPVGQTPLRFLLAKELDLESAQVLSVEESRHGLKIVLAAKDQDLQGHLALLFDPEPLTLAGWSFVDPRGEMTVVSLEDVQEKKRLSSRLFRVPEAGGTFLRDN